MGRIIVMGRIMVERAEQLDGQLYRVKTFVGQAGPQDEQSFEQGFGLLYNFAIAAQDTAMMAIETRVEPDFVRNLAMALVKLAINNFVALVVTQVAAARQVTTWSVAAGLTVILGQALEESSMESF